jgi:uncharacterized protein
MEINKNKKLIISLALLVIVIIAFFYFSNKGNVVYIAGETVRVEIADEEEERVKGLSGREKLSAGEGVLFIFPEEAPNTIWMKDMNFPIDIIWLNVNKEVIYIKENAGPESFPGFFGGHVDSKYVLEVGAGFTAAHDLEVGDKADFTY